MEYSNSRIWSSALTFSMRSCVGSFKHIMPNTRCPLTATSSSIQSIYSPQNKLPAIDTSLLIYTERHPKYRNANFHPLHQFIFEKLFAGELLFFYADVYDRFRLNISNGRLWDSDFYFANWLFSPLLQILWDKTLMLLDDSLSLSILALARRVRTRLFAA